MIAILQGMWTLFAVAFLATLAIGGGVILALKILP